MATPTGPGKIEVIPDHTCPESDNLKVLLYNFDIAGNTLKPEHKAWLDVNVRPLVKKPGVTIAVRGLASRSGSDQFNKTLSEGRVGNAKKHLLSYGATIRQMTVSAGGETDAMLTGVPDGVEDERWRAVLVLVEIPLANVNVKFERVMPASRNDGFDPTGRNPWLMIPFQNGTRDIRIVDGAGLTLVSTRPHVVQILKPVDAGNGHKVTEDSEIVTLRAASPGDAEILAVNACGKVRARLEVSVLRQLEVKVAFHYVSHPEIGTKTRRVGQEAALLRVVNSIFNPQTNIKFTSIQARSLPLTGSFGKEVNEAVTAEWDGIVKNRNTGARFNVFFVKEIEQGPESASGTSDGDDADALTTIGPPGDCLFEDEAGVQEGESLAHEAGHALNVRHNTPISSQRHMLMWDTTDQRGRFIPRVHVVRMRKSLS